MRSWSRAERSRRQPSASFPPWDISTKAIYASWIGRASSPSASSSAFFVNPLQFGPHEDLARYPRDLPRDRKLAEARGVDCLFVPDVSAMYPAEPLARVIPGPIADTLEGPRGRAISPACYGREQAVSHRRARRRRVRPQGFSAGDTRQTMVQDLDFGVCDRHAPTVPRAGRARPVVTQHVPQSDERRSALALSRALRTLEQTWRGGKRIP